MTADRTDDILSLLEEIHGDGLSRREATVNDAVGQIERSAYRGYSALRKLAQHGTPRLPAHAEIEAPETTALLKTAETPETADTPETAESNAENSATEPSEAETRIATRPDNPEKPRNDDPIEVISGDGANFRERGHTQTHIIRRPKNWFGRR